MRKFILFVTPFLLAIIIFGGILLLVNRGGGKGALQVTSIPPSNVYLGGKLIGKTPLCVGRETCESSALLPVGDYSLKLVPIEGDFAPFEEKITINKSTLTVVERTFAKGQASKGSVISLAPLDNKKDAELLVISIPDKANVYLDGNLAGTTALLLKDVTPSDHDLLIGKEGYSDKLVKISAKLGYKLTSLISLGVDLHISSPSAQASTENNTSKATGSAEIISQKVVILDTPTGFLRVREKGLLTAPEIDRVSPGETFEMLSEKDGWFEIKLNSPAGEGKTGWVSGQYARKK